MLPSAISGGSSATPTTSQGGSLVSSRWTWRPSGLASGHSLRAKLTETIALRAAPLSSPREKCPAAHHSESDNSKVVGRHGVGRRRRGNPAGFRVVRGTRGLSSVDHAYASLTGVWHLGQCRGLGAGQGTRTIEQGAKRDAPPGACFRELDVRDHHVISQQRGHRTPVAPRTLHGQSGGDQEREGDGKLAGDIDVSEADARPARPRGRKVALQARGHIDACREPDRGQRHRQRLERREPADQQQHTPVEDGLGSREPEEFRAQERQLRQPDGDQQPGHRSGRREHDSLGEELSDDWPVSRPERRADGQFTATLLEPRQEQPSDVCAPDDEQEADHCGQHADD